LQRAALVQNYLRRALVYSAKVSGEDATPKERKALKQNLKLIVRPRQTLLFWALDPNYLFKIAGTQKSKRFVTG
jgi:hypothetical protein